jgi:hypothetical protein
MVEAALVDAAARVFLEQLGHGGPSTPLTSTGVPLPREIIDVDAFAACLREFRALTAEPPPDLMRGLADERVWILLDLARHGTGLSRQRATLELRQLLHQLGSEAEQHVDLLRDLSAQLAGAVRGGGFPVVFAALLFEAQAALRRLDACPAPLREPAQEQPR